MQPQSPAAFISYSREDSVFALQLAQDLKAARASVWLDQLDIPPGAPWDNAVEEALASAPQMLLILSPASVSSRNVRNEIAYAEQEGKTVVPVLHLDCKVPLQLLRNQRIDFRSDYAAGLGALVSYLQGTPRPAKPSPVDSPHKNERTLELLKKRKLLFAGVAGAALLLLVVGLGIALHFHGRNGTAPSSQAQLPNRNAIPEPHTSDGLPPGATSANGGAPVQPQRSPEASSQSVQTVPGGGGSPAQQGRSPDAATQVTQAAAPHQGAKFVLEQTIEADDEWVDTVSFSPDGRIVASGQGGGGNLIILWDAASGKRLRSLRGHKNGIASVVFSPDGRTLVSGSRDATIKFWDVGSGTLIRTLNGDQHQVMNVAISSNGRMLASCGGDGIKLWETATGALVRTIQIGSDNTLAIAFSPDGHTLASGDLTNNITIWDSTTGKKMQTLEGHSGWTDSLMFSPDGRTLASASYDHTIKLWDVKTWELSQTLRSDGGNVLGLAFSHSGSLLASAYFDGQVRIYSGYSSKLLQTLSVTKDDESYFGRKQVNAVAFSPDDRLLAIGAGDTKLTLWKISSP